ncbi:glutaredoxin family protein [Halobacillus shinanisalinarum]|uniref:Glutaredoxin family protein n=1 Tax=Halobacillus shinanisalinarum TaxID=2932258 RepID=A0ABY4H2I5_9BACI|nr:glutaredoxin family protein [Halobacillus shinanisalinarum]UOQ94334.1 glutaredoxin family protein [Halobacillus shinanisalinarum]
MNTLTLYTKKNCKLCDEVKELIDILSMDYQITMAEVDIEQDAQLLTTYFLEIPVLFINGEKIDYRGIDIFSLRERLH